MWVFGQFIVVGHRCWSIAIITVSIIAGDVIQWPRAADYPKLADKWQARAGFPGVIGAIDGTYIKTTGTRSEQRDAYICRKGFPAMHLQVKKEHSIQYRRSFIQS